MTTITHTPKYPVVDIAPGMWKVVGNFNATDYSIIAGMSGFGYAYGWFTGAKPTRIGNSRICLGITFLGGIAVAASRSFQRFAGLHANEAEVAKYGALTAAQYDRYKKKLAAGNSEMIDNTDPRDEPLTQPIKRYGSFTPEEVRQYREKSKTQPHVFNPFDEEEKK